MQQVMQMERLLYMNEQINQLVWGWGTVLALLGISLYFLVATRFLLFRRLLWIVRVIGSALFAKKGRSSRQAMFTALAGTLGVGSIVGVAAAIALGGPGALFWMGVSALFGMVLKYAEITVSCAYQKKQPNGRMLGGAMVLLGEVRRHPFWSVCFCLFCMLAAFGVGNLAPASTITSSVRTIGDVASPWVGLALIALVLLIIKGHGRRIQQFNAFLIPFASLLYIAACLIVLTKHLPQLPHLVSLVVRDAFDGMALAGGGMGFVVTRAMHYGVTRGVFSHEAGMGSAPLSYASSPVQEPVEQGFWGMFEVFLDTFVICMLSGFVVLCQGDGALSADGAAVLIEAFGDVFGEGGRILFACMIVLFAFPSILGWYYYAGVCLDYLFTVRWVKAVYAALFLALLLAGCCMEVQAVWDISDTLNGCMILPNLLALLLFRKEIVHLTRKYFRAHHKRRVIRSQTIGTKAARRLKRGRSSQYSLAKRDKQKRLFGSRRPCALCITSRQPPFIR